MPYIIEVENADAIYPVEVPDELSDTEAIEYARQRVREFIADYHKKDFSDKYNTQLSPEDEKKYQSWANRIGKSNDTFDYDLRGAWKEINSGRMSSSNNGHLSDRYKKPNHPTFSDESIYNGVDGYQGGQWSVDKSGSTVFTPSKHNLNNLSLEKLKQYFSQYEPDAKLFLNEEDLIQSFVPKPQDSKLDVATDVAGSIGSSILGGMAGSAAGLATLPIAPEEARNVADTVSQAIAVGPMTEQGQQLLQSLAESYPVERLNEIMSEVKPYVVDYLGQQGEAIGGERGRVYGEAMADFVPDIVGMALGAKALTAAPSGAIKTAETIARTPAVIGRKTSDAVLSTAQTATKGVGYVLDKGKALLPSQMQKRKVAYEALKRGETRNVDTAGYRLENGLLKDDILEQEALDNGFDPVLVANLRDANQATREKGLAMVRHRDTAERGLLPPDLGNVRAADIAGNSLKQRFDFLDKTINDAKTKRNEALKSMKGKPVDLTEATNNFKTRMDEVGIGYGRNAAGDFDPAQPLDFTGSVFALNKSAQNRIQEFVSNLAGAGKVDALKAHHYKRGIDDLVGYGRQAAEGITGEAETFMKGFRHDLNEALRKVSPDYADANDVMTEIIDTVKEANRLIGKNYDPTDRQFGLLSRTILTNYKSGDNVNTLIADMNELTTKYGGNFSDDLPTLVRLYTDLDKVVRAEAPGSLRGIMQGQSIPRSGTDAALNFGQREMNALRQKDRFSALNSIEQLLERNP